MYVSLVKELVAWRDLISFMEGKRSKGSKKKELSYLTLTCKPLTWVPKLVSPSFLLPFGRCLRS